MAQIIPFRGYTYNPETVDIESALAPPYDVVKQDERDRFCRENPFNILRLELPDSPLEVVRELFSSWINAGVIQKDREESLYPYEIQFELNGVNVTRTGLICLLKVEPWERRVVLPHEKTFKKVTRERLELLKTVRAQFSQIFLLSKDLKQLSHALKWEGRDLLFHCRDHLGNLHRVFKISDRDVIDVITAPFADRSLYIADGHHRYTTALTFREECERTGLFRGVNPPPHEYVMAYIVDTSDPGLICQPTHRAVRLEGLEAGEVKTRLARYFDTVVELNDLESLETLDDYLEKYSSTPSFFVIFLNQGKAVLYALNGQGRALLDARKLTGPMSELDVTVVDEIAIRETFMAGAGELKERGMLCYEARTQDLMKGVLSHKIIFYLRPTSVDSMLRVAEAGLTMPHKATYFSPKILTGSVIREL